MATGYNRLSTQKDLGVSLQETGFTDGAFPMSGVMAVPP
jgi:hypothetical protein